VTAWWHGSPASSIGGSGRVRYAGNVSRMGRTGISGTAGWGTLNAKGMPGPISRVGGSRILSRDRSGAWFRPALPAHERNQVPVGGGEDHGSDIGRGIMATTLDLAQVELDPAVRPRVRVDVELVKEYAAEMRAGAAFSPIDVVWDGFHHVMAAPGVSGASGRWSTSSPARARMRGGRPSPRTQTGGVSCSWRSSIPRKWGWAAGGPASTARSIARRSARSARSWRPLARSKR